MTSSDDRLAERKSLEDSIDAWGSWLIGFIWPVVVGLVMEFYTIMGFEWSRDWNQLVDRIGLLLVTAGVSGELLAESKTHGAERRLRRINEDLERLADERIAELNLKAEQEHAARVRIEQSIAVRDSPLSNTPCLLRSWPNLRTFHHRRVYIYRRLPLVVK